MRDDVAMQRRPSLVGRTHEMIPAELISTNILHDYVDEFWSKS